MNRKQSKLYSSEEVLFKLLQDSNRPLARDFVRWKLIKDWDKVVQPEIAKRTFPVALRGYCIYIWVSGSEALQDYIFLTPQFILAINKFAKKELVKKIMWTRDKRKLPELSDVEQDNLKKILKLVKEQKEAAKTTASSKKSFNRNGFR